MRAFPGFRRSAVVFLLLAVLPMASCEEGGSGIDLDPDADLTESAQEVEAAVDAFLVDNDAVVSVSGLSGRMAVSCGGSLMGLAEFLGAVRDARARPARGPEAISSQCVGRTMVLTGPSGGYVAGGSGPSGGVRFELYGVDAFGQPTSPLDAIGHVDVIDASSGNSLQGSMQAVVGGATRIDFSGGATFGQTAASFNADGFFSSNGSDRLDVSMDAELSGTETQTGASLDASISSDDFSASMSFDGSAELDSEAVDGTFTSRIQQGGAVLDFLAEFEPSGDMSGEVRLNGVVVANFTANVNTGSVQVSDASGGALSQSEVAALERMFEATASAVEPIVAVGLLPLLLSGF